MTLFMDVRYIDGNELISDMINFNNRSFSKGVIGSTNMRTLFFFRMLISVYMEM